MAMKLKNSFLGKNSSLGKNCSFEKILSISLSSFFIFIAISIIIFLLFFLFSKKTITINLTIEQFIIIIGILFTLATLIIALFGIINYFQSSEAQKRLGEIEIYYRQNAREIAVMRIFLLLLNDYVILSSLHRKSARVLLLIHLYKIAESKDLAQIDEEGVFELEVSFIEVMKMSGLPGCKQIFHILDSNSYHRDEYRTCLIQFKKLINYYELLENK